MVKQAENPTTKLVRRALALGCFAGVALVPPPAFADDHPASVQIDQVQLNDVWSNMTVEIPDTAWEASSTSTAVGNAAAGLVMQGTIDLDVNRFRLFQRRFALSLAVREFDEAIKSRGKKLSLVFFPQRLNERTRV